MVFIVGYSLTAPSLLGWTCVGDVRSTTPGSGGGTRRVVDRQVPEAVEPAGRLLSVADSPLSSATDGRQMARSSPREPSGVSQIVTRAVAVS